MCTFISKKIQLKDGFSIEVREVEVSDARDLIATIREYSEESEFIPTVDGEFNPTLEQEVAWIETMRERANSICLIVIQEDQIIGNISVYGSTKEVMKHTAIIGLGILNTCRGKGIGNVLLSEMIGWAQRNPVLDYLYLETMSNNIGARALYEKYGFCETGIKPKEIKRPNGEYLDTIIMSLNVKE